MNREEKKTTKEVKLPAEFQYNSSSRKTSMEQLGDKINELIDYLKAKGV